MPVAAGKAERRLCRAAVSPWARWVITPRTRTVWARRATGATAGLLGLDSCRSVRSGVAGCPESGRRLRGGGPGARGRVRVDPGPLGPGVVRSCGRPPPPAGDRLVRAVWCGCCIACDRRLRLRLGRRRHHVRPGCCGGGRRGVARGVDASGGGRRGLLDGGHGAERSPADRVPAMAGAVLRSRPDGRCGPGRRVPNWTWRTPISAIWPTCSAVACSIPPYLPALAIAAHVLTSLWVARARSRRSL